MYCSECGKVISDKSKFCRYCGAVIEPEETVVASNSSKATHATAHQPKPVTPSAKITPNPKPANSSATQPEKKKLTLSV